MHILYACASLQTQCYFRHLSSNWAQNCSITLFLHFSFNSHLPFLFMPSNFLGLTELLFPTSLLHNFLLSFPSLHLLNASSAWIEPVFTKLLFAFSVPQSFLLDILSCQTWNCLLSPPKNNCGEMPASLKLTSHFLLLFF